MLERRLRRGKNEEKVFHLFTPGSRELIKRDFAFERLNTLTVYALFFGFLDAYECLHIVLNTQIRNKGLFSKWY
jgi:hypothetical protein